MDRFGLKIVSIRKLDNDLLDIEVETKGPVKTRFRLVRPDEVWPFGQSGHNACNGKGYVVHALAGVPGTLPIKATYPNPATGEPKTVTEYRASCTCAAQRYLKAHPFVLHNGLQGYALWPLDQGHKAFPPVEMPPPPSPTPPKKSDADVKLAHATKLRQRADEAEARANTMEPDIIEAVAAYEKEIKVFKDQLIEAEAKKSEHREAQAKAEQEAIEAQRVADAALAAARAAQKNLEAVNTETKAQTDTLQTQVVALEKQIRQVPVPSRIARLKKEQRFLRDEVESLRVRAKRIEDKNG